MRIRGYEVEVQKLDRELGGGFVAFAPALDGCLADGGSQREALRNLEDAIACWIEAAREHGRSVPPPGAAPDAY